MSQILRKSDESNRLAFQKNAHTHIKKKNFTCRFRGFKSTTQSLNPTLKALFR